MLFTNILPEAICCLGTLNVYVVLLMLLCEQTFMATTNIRYLQVHLAYSLSFTNMLCLWCVGDIAMHIHTNFHGH